MFLWLFCQVQINNNIRHDTFTEIPVSLVLFSLICIDVVERIRHCRLTGQGERNILLTCYAKHIQWFPFPTFLFQLLW